MASQFANVSSMYVLFLIFVIVALLASIKAPKIGFLFLLAGILYAIFSFVK